MPGNSCHLCLACTLWWTDLATQTVCMLHAFGVLQLLHFPISQLFPPPASWISGTPPTHILLQAESANANRHPPSCPPVHGWLGTGPPGTCVCLHPCLIARSAASVPLPPRRQVVAGPASQWCSNSLGRDWLADAPCKRPHAIQTLLYETCSASCCNTSHTSLATLHAPNKLSTARQAITEPKLQGNLLAACAAWVGDGRSAGLLLPAGITNGAHAKHDVQVALAGRHKVAPQLQGALQAQLGCCRTDGLKDLKVTMNRDTISLQAAGIHHMCASL